MSPAPHQYSGMPAMLLTALLLLGLVGSPALAADYGLDNDRAAAEAGDSEALIRMADRYETGDGVPFDLGAASAFLKLAAERGDASAQYRLGLLQAGGLDPDADLAEAYGWLRLAASGAEDAPTGLLAGAMSEALAERLDSGVVEQAELVIAGFQPATGPAELPALGMTLQSDPSTLLAMLPTTGCGTPGLQKAEDGKIVLIAYAPTGSMIDGVITPGLRADLAERGAALDVTELSPSICMIRKSASVEEYAPAATEVSVAGGAEGGHARLVDGEKLVIDVAATDQPRYVSVDYVVHTGEVWHLYPSAGADGYLPAGQSLRLGDGIDGPAWEVGAPFGEDLVIVTLSSLPSAIDQPLTEAAEAYQARLSHRLQTTPPAESLRVLAQVVAIEAR